MGNWVVLFAVLFVSVGPVFMAEGVSAKNACEAEMYRNAMFTEPSEAFSPYDQIYIVVDCPRIQAGTHVMLANWIHEKQGLIRSNSHEFDQPVDDRRAIYFWFKLSRRGALSSTLLNKDFHEENFGRWRVEIFLDDSLLVTRSFTIEP